MKGMNGIETKAENGCPLDRTNGTSRKKAILPPKKEIRLLFLLGCALGIVVFVAVCGVRILDFTYTDWLTAKVDSLQHFLGWQAFRQTQWTFPIGLTNALSYPQAVSIVYTDSIPLLAIPFKLISPLLPVAFQYIGLWDLLCYALQGGLSAVLLYRFVKNKALCLIGAVFFVASMPLAMRMIYHHDSLVAQWLLLLGFLLWLYEAGKDD